MEPQPASIGARDALGFAKEGDEQKQNQVGVDLRLQLEVPGKIFRSNRACPILKLERGMECVIDLFGESDQRANIMVADTCARIVALELFDQPAGIINADIKTIVGRA